MEDRTGSSNPVVYARVVLFLMLLVLTACGGTVAAPVTTAPAAAPVVTSAPTSPRPPPETPTTLTVSPTPTPTAAALAAAVGFVWQITGAPYPFVRPSAIAVDGQLNIYVVDGGNQRIQKFDGNGKFLIRWGSEGSGDGQFLFRVGSAHFGGVAGDGQGNVYVTDPASCRIQKFDSHGTFLAQWGTLGDGAEAFNFPGGIALDNQGNIYVVDVVGERVQKFRPK